MRFNIYPSFVAVLGSLLLVSNGLMGGQVARADSPGPSLRIPDVSQVRPEKGALPARPAPATPISQPKPSQPTAMLSQPMPRADRLAPLPPVGGSAPSPESVDSALLAPADQGRETITQRAASGAVQVERQVVLDAEGNYINDGRFVTYDAAGKVVRSGEYRKGSMQGRWIQVIASRQEGTLLKEAMAGFQEPFVSEATFVDGKLDGAWAVRDRDQRPVTQWQFSKGARDGTWTWLYPNGEKWREMTYKAGKAVGQLREWDAQGKVRTLGTFVDGRPVEHKVGSYDANHKQYEGDYVSAAADAEPEFDWWNNTAKVSQVEDRSPPLKYGVWTAWYPNGQKQVEGEYREDVPTGQFTWWHENGQKQGEGQYDRGVKTGVWTTWHENGQKEIRSEFRAGVPVGSFYRWKTDGKLAELYKFDGMSGHKKETAAPKAQAKEQPSRTAASKSGAPAANEAKGACQR
jgi:antitoxin component YwqK of YwqJK toxin-antitoxin module